MLDKNMYPISAEKSCSTGKNIAIGSNKAGTIKINCEAPTPSQFSIDFLDKSILRSLKVEKNKTKKELIPILNNIIVKLTYTIFKEK